jgi:hypothetical protein
MSWRLSVYYVFKETRGREEAAVKKDVCDDERRERSAEFTPMLTCPCRV